MKQLSPNEMPPPVGDDIYSGIIDLPDGKQCRASMSAYVDKTTGALTETGLSIEWLDGTPLTGDEWNTEFVVKGHLQYLWDFVVEALFLKGKDHESPNSNR